LTPTPPDPAVIDYIENYPEWRESVMSVGPHFFELKPSHDVVGPGATCSRECWNWLMEDNDWPFGHEDRLAFLAFENTGNHRAEA
jgi:hypothetical protein